LAHNLPPDDRRCTAKSKSAIRRREELLSEAHVSEHESIIEHFDLLDDRCPMWAIKGGFVCYHHGGAAPQAIAAAKERIRTREVTAFADSVLAQEGIEGVEDPLQELSKLASGSKALMEALGQRVNSLDQLEHFDAKNSPAIKAEVQMYERALDRTARLLESLVKAGYTERQIKIQETEAMLVAGVIKRTVAALGLTPAQQQRAQVILAEEFRALAPKPVPR
jgi:hypothetical protein